MAVTDEGEILFIEQEKNTVLRALKSQWKELTQLPKI